MEARMLDGLFGLLDLLLNLDFFWSPEASGSGDVTAMEGCSGMPPKP